MKINSKKILIGLVMVLLISLFAIYFAFNREINLANDEIASTTLIQIAEGKDWKSVSADFASLKLIKNEKAFYYYAVISSKKIVPGYFEITPGMSTKEIISLIDSGQTKIIKLTIPEGYRVEQIGLKLADAGIISYADFVTAATSYEGKLFPDTYYFDPIMTAPEIIKKMTDDYDKRTADLTVTSEKLVLASIVEKEAASDDDRGLIAGIYQNRIDAGMKLQSDPTVAYGRDSNEIATMTAAEIENYTFWKAAKTAEFTSVVSDFNTYLISGLPPKPICDPGLASIKAALNPTKSNYYFFLYGSDGKIHPAETRAQHLANVAKYL